MTHDRSATRELYELATLSFPFLSAGEASAGVRDWVTAPIAKGTLLGCWRTEIGELGRLVMLRSFADASELAAERTRTLMSANPFNAGRLLTGLDTESYAPFPFLPPVSPRRYGRVFEARTYRLAPGGLPAVLAGWERALGDVGDYTAHLVMAMHAIDGMARILHLWGFAGFEEREHARSDAYRSGAWPPQVGPSTVRHAATAVLVPEPFSPLC